MKFHFEPNLPKGPYENVDLSLWRDWRWQLKNALRDENSFSRLYELSDSERSGFKSSEGLFQIRSTPYYAGLGSRTDPTDPIRLIQTPDFKETDARFQQMKDPLGEDVNSVTSRLVHRYADRVLFLVTDFCSVYCRFCTRKRFTATGASRISLSELVESLAYIRGHPGIREVILSGGDPLTLDDSVLEEILREIRKIDHVEIIRVGTRMPVVNPFRITDSLVQVFRRHKPVFLMTHFNHPRELTLDAAMALERIADSGIPVMNQMVLLNGINNHPAVVQALSRRLLYLRVKPYYMFQCDPSMGTDHLRTSIEDSLGIQRELWGHLSGLAMPTLSVDVPNGGGKVAFHPNFVESRVDNIWNFKGFDGVENEYVDPTADCVRRPENIEDYIAEWEILKSAKHPNV